MKKTLLLMAALAAFSSQAQGTGNTGGITEDVKTVSVSNSGDVTNISPTSSAPTAFELSKDGFTDFIVTSVPNKSQSELFKKALDWVALTYKDPKEVIKAQIDNDYIRIEGVSLGMVVVNALGRQAHDGRYQIEISFKDGKYKFDVIKMEAYYSPSQYYAGGWSDVDLGNVSGFYNKKGELRGAFKYYPEIPTYFNQLNQQLKDFVSSDAIPSKKSEW
jgi:hypothetical protein